MTIKPLSELSDAELMARVMWGEARNQGYLGMLAVGHVILNRFKDKRRRFGKSLKGVMLRKWAFSCLLESDPNLPEIVEGPKGDMILVCRVISSLALCGFTIDPTHGATHYFNPSVVMPTWAAKLEYKVDIGNHRFFEET